MRKFALTYPLPYGRIIWEGMRMAVSEKQMAYDKSTYQVF